MKWVQQYTGNQLPMSAMTKDQKMSLPSAKNLMTQMQPGIFYFPHGLIQWFNNGISGVWYKYWLL